MDKSELRELSFTCCILCGPTIGQEIIENRSVMLKSRKEKCIIGYRRRIYYRKKEGVDGCLKLKH